MKGVNRIKQSLGIGKRRNDKGVAPFPERIQLETTSLCPCDCVMCTSKIKKRENKFMPDELLGKIIEECSRHDVLMQLLFYGDPCLDPRIPRIVRECKAKGLTAFITTPGVALTEKLGKELLEAGLDRCGFSLDGNSKETYEKIRRGADFEKTVHNIETFIKMKNEGNYATAIDVRMVGLELNKHEWEDFLERWKPRVDQTWVGRYSTKGGESDAFQPVEPRNKYYCDLFEKEMCITADGNVTICCRDHGRVIVGNVRSQSIEAVWNGTERKEMREKMRRGGSFNIDYCRNCSY